MDAQEPAKQYDVVELRKITRRGYPRRLVTLLVPCENARFMAEINGAASKAVGKNLALYIKGAEVDALTFAATPDVFAKVKIVDSKIKRIEREAFKSLTITDLELSNNEILEVDAQAFSGLGHLRFLKTCGDIPPGLLQSVEGVEAFHLNLRDWRGLIGCASVAQVSRLEIDHNELPTVPSNAVPFRGLSCLSLRCSKIETMQEDALAGLEKLEQLDLSENRMKAVPAGLFKDLISLQILRLNGNRLEELPGGVFDTCRNLELVYLNANLLSTVPAGIFSGLPKIGTLYLYNNRIETIADDAFKDSPSLRYLKCEENLLEELPRFRNLREISAWRNRIQKVSKGAFEDTKGLTALTLSENRISVLEDGCFEGLHDLISLDLEDNSLTTITKGTFKDVLVGYELILNSNRIEKIEDEAFASVKNLAYLQLANNPLRKVTLGMFSGLEELTALNLENCGLVELARDVFNNTPSLRTLYLNKNKIEKLNADAFSPLQYLEELYLDDNSISTIDGTFQLDALSELRLTANRLEGIRAGLFATPNLSTLDLSRNRVKELDAEAFAQLPELYALLLASNQLATLNEAFNRVSSTLVELDLSCNEIHAVEGLATFPALEKLVLDDNDLGDLAKLNLKQFEKLSHLSLRRNRIKTLPERSFEGMAALTTVALSHNQLEEVNLAFSNLEELTTLELDNNKIERIHEDAFNALLMDEGWLKSTAEVIDKPLLNLKNNNLRTLNEKVMAGLKRIPKVFLAGNPLDESVLQQFHT